MDSSLTQIQVSLPQLQNNETTGRPMPMLPLPSFKYFLSDHTPPRLPRINTSRRIHSVFNTRPTQRSPYNRPVEISSELKSSERKNHKASRKCKVEECRHNIASLGLCVRHGGGTRCSQSDCNRAAVSKKLCRAHGGGRRCIESGCDKGAQSNTNKCWKHGGGVRCKTEGCTKSRRAHRRCTQA
jgi:hypothetical protein